MLNEFIETKDFSKEAPMPIKRSGASHLSVKELAEKVGVHHNTVLYWINQGQVRAVRSGLSKQSPWMIPQEEVNRIIEEMENGRTE
jgi:excisionase family DNA binding protein